MSKITLPKSKEVIVLKEALSRKEVRAYRELVNRDVTCTESGEVDRSSFLNNVEEQKDAIVLMYVETINDKPFTEEILGKMDGKDFELLLKKCQKEYADHYEKKN